MRMRLDQLEPGERAVIHRIGGRGPFRRRLLELGLLPGTFVQRTGQAPLGDPLTYRVREAVICLRRTEAATVEVEPAPVVGAAAK